MYTDISYKEREYTIVYNVIKNEKEKNAIIVLNKIDLDTEYKEALKTNNSNTIFFIMIISPMNLE